MRTTTHLLSRAATAAGCLLAAAPLGADEWAVLGPRAMGMGGAGVAVTRGGLSTYWNPAALAPPRAPRVDTFWDLEIPVTVNGAATNDFLKTVDEVADLVTRLDFDSLENILSAPSTTLSEAQLQDTLRLLADVIPALGESGTGLVANGTGGILSRIWRFGISGLAVANAGGVTRVDLTNLAIGDEGITGVVGPGSDRSGVLSGAGQSFADSLAAQGLGTQDQAEEVVFQAEQGGLNTADPAVQANLRNVLAATQANLGGSPDNFFTANQSGVDLQGILLQEYAIAYSQPLFDIFSVGASAKLLYGWTYFKPFTLEEILDFGDLVGEVFQSENREESFNFGLDLGLLVEPTSWLAAGLTARNVNRPTFAFKGPGDYVVEPQLRAGVGLNPLPGLTIAADVDCWVNQSMALPGYDSQVVGGGAEYALFDVLFLRAGASKNFREEAEDILLHAGLGFRIGFFQMDFAAAVTPDFTEVTSDLDGDSVELPERAGLSLMVAFNLPLE